MIEILKKVRLVKVQRNDLFDEIVKVGMNPNDFNVELLDISRGELKFFEKNHEEYYFNLKKSNSINQFHVQAILTSNKGRDKKYSNGYWPIVIKAYQEWLKSLKNEVEVEEKWESLGYNPEHIEFSNFTDNSKFTDEETLIIAEKLGQLKKRIILLDIPEEAKTTLSEQIDNLEEQSGYLDKVNWQQLFVGAIVMTISRLSITKESAALIWNTVRNFFSNLLIG